MQETAMRFDEKVRVTSNLGGDLAMLDISMRFVLPPIGELADELVVFFCSPGGAIAKGYFDLDAAGDRSFSFAEAMARRGWITIAIDHPGVGESDRPADGYALMPDVVADIDHLAFALARRRLAEGLGGHGPIDTYTTIGIGHSMGGMLTGTIQARHEAYDAVIILGSGPYGFLSQLIDPLKPYAGDPEGLRRDLVSVLRREGIAPYRQLEPSPGSQSVFGGGDRRGGEALRAVRSQLLVVPGLSVMTPGSWGPEARHIAAPLFLAFGDDDICPNPREVPALFAGAKDITLLVLPQTGHMHFIFPSRQLLFDRIGTWAKGLPA